jgi:DNA replication protein DnaC
MSTTQNKSLESNLDQIGLRTMLEMYETVLKTATRQKKGPLWVLDQLVAEEARARFSRMVERRIRAARIPVRKTLDTFDFNHARKIDRDQILRLFDLDFIERKTNVCMIARSGLGKTHLASALALAACQQGHSVLFSTAIDVVNQLQAAQSDNTFLRRLKSYLAPSVLVLDELGYLPIDRHGADLLFQVISGRYERGSVILTTNRAFKEWASVFNDATVADAVINRIVHNSEVVTLEGKSYRLPPDHGE